MHSGIFYSFLFCYENSITTLCQVTTYCLKITCLSNPVPRLEKCIAQPLRLNGKLKAQLPLSFLNANHILNKIFRVE